MEAPLQCTTWQNNQSRNAYHPETIHTQSTCPTQHLQQTTTAGLINFQHNNSRHPAKPFKQLELNIHHSHPSKHYLTQSDPPQPT